MTRHNLGVPTHVALLRGVNVGGRNLFLNTPGGLGRSELAAHLARTGGPLSTAGSATVRNWATMKTLLALCQRERR